MDFTQILKKKRNGEELNESEINYFIKNTVNGKIQDSQIGAMLMAMFIKGLTTTETVILTKSMLHSGDILTWNPDWNDILVDKHSTGGVGDKISIPLAPALAACGLKIPMLSGRSLEFTGGTLDKLESIPGYNVNLSISELEKCLNNTGCFITGTTGNICPADCILYAKRNDTSTIDYINLIVASIISKKASGGIKSLILDIKVGRGAFMKDLETAKQLGRQMVNVAGELGIKAKVYLTKMDYPLGRAVGNALEIFECVELMKGKYIPHIHELVTIFGGTLLEMLGKVNTLQDGITMVENVLKNGEAMKCFQKMLINQGVNEKISKDLCYGDEQNLPLSFAKYKTEILAKQTGWVEDIDALTIGNLCYQISSSTDNGQCKPSLDLSGGAFIKKTIGEKVHENEPWLIVYHSTPNLTIDDSQKINLENAIKITPHEFLYNAVDDLIILCIE